MPQMMPLNWLVLYLVLFLGLGSLLTCWHLKVSFKYFFIFTDSLPFLSFGSLSGGGKIHY